MLFRRKNAVKKVSKNEFFDVTNKIKSHFLRIKDMQLHTLNRINHVHDSHSCLSNEVKTNNNIISQWLDYFNALHTQHKSEMGLLKDTIVKLNNKIDKNQNRDDSYIKSVVENCVDIPSWDKETLKKELIEELHKKQKELGVINVNNDYNDYNATPYNVDNGYLSLTKSERKILAKLFDSADPRTYNDLSNSTGHSPNTIKVYINSMKKKGVRFEEIDAPNGTKMYAISNKDKVKKLYNF